MLDTLAMMMVVRRGKYLAAFAQYFDGRLTGGMFVQGSLFFSDFGRYGNLGQDFGRFPPTKSETGILPGKREGYSKISPLLTTEL